MPHTIVLVWAEKSCLLCPKLVAPTSIDTAPFDSVCPIDVLRLCAGEELCCKDKKRHQFLGINVQISLHFQGNTVLQK